MGWEDQVTANLKVFNRVEKESRRQEMMMLKDVNLCQEGKIRIKSFNTLTCPYKSEENTDERL